MILAFDETKAIVPELKGQGWDMSKTYYSDGNTADYSKDFAEGHPRGRPGHHPGCRRLRRVQGPPRAAGTTSAEGQELADFAYGPESYDATILAALAALKGGDTTPQTIQENLAAVSGGTDGGTAVRLVRRVRRLIAAGDEIHYTGPSGIGPINEQNDPSSAFVGIYTFDDEQQEHLQHHCGGFGRVI